MRKHERGLLREGRFADVIRFDAEKIWIKQLVPSHIAMPQVLYICVNSVAMLQQGTMDKALGGIPNLQEVLRREIS